MRNFFLVLFSMCTLLYHCTASANSNRIDNQKSIQTVQYEVIDLAADTFSDNSLLYVSGKIRNTSFYPIQGYIIVRFQDVDNIDMGFVETSVNKNLPINHYRTGAFEIAVNIEKETKIKNVSVEFININK
ncbi:hypothetical protein [Desulfobacula toluolica]|uniref:Lipoprotein n=1 Tax=Desulfobacula toluolica (strain DSM 7467 / Tol2) TaxID=651182 RepID=K0NKE1_DESTT|nr:hypothetical protein [Desulfobacula toluolica]CCK80398.1 uncharacterized protein TOL2_C22370 [Desulfobacula toluolica Tol2]